MSRRSRRLHVRLLRVTALLAGGAFCYQRWQLRSFGASPVSSFRTCVSQPSTLPSPRHVRWSQLQSSTPADPFDLLVIGGGLMGLYTAVDAAQRGLRVALVDAGDVGGGSSTSRMPTVSPGPFAYVQRAIRQRDMGWLGIAVSVMKEQTTWHNVAPDCVVVPDSPMQYVAKGVRRWVGRVTGANAAESLGMEGRPATGTMLLPALHSSEMLEYASAAMVSTVFSVLCGPARLHSLLPPFSIENRLPALAKSSTSVSVKGGVVARDVQLQGSTAAIALARTAEEFGVVLLTYAPVMAIREHASSATSMMVAQVRDDLLSAESSSDKPSVQKESLLTTSRWWSMWYRQPASAQKKGRMLQTDEQTLQAAVYARGIVNCTGCWVDAVRSLYDENAADTVPSAYAGFQAYSYLVAPEDSLHATLLKETSGVAPNAVEGAAAVPLHASTRTAGLQVSSPRVSFASTMVLPWWDRCVLLGPIIAPLTLQPSLTTLSSPSSSSAARSDWTLLSTTTTTTSIADGGVLLSSPDGYKAQRARAVAMLAACGVTLQAPRLLSCVSQIVPYMREPKEVPFLTDLLRRGYALHTSSLPGPEAEGETAGESPPPRRAVPLLHVYGGTPVMTRRIAEDVVDALVDPQTGLLPAVTTRPLFRCRTQHLQLSTPKAFVASASAAGDPMDRVRDLIANTYAERLVDVIARRTHVGYTSPQDAMLALPLLADVMSELRGWSTGRRQSELEAARRFVAAVAVPVGPA